MVSIVQGCAFIWTDTRIVSSVKYKLDGMVTGLQDIHVAQCMF